MTGFYLIARVIAPVGNNGVLKLESFSDFPDRFKKLKTVYIDFFGNKKPFSVEKFRVDSNSVTVKFNGFDSKEDVIELTGKEIFVDEQNLVKLPKDTFFIHDLVGSNVISGNDNIGVISDVYQLPANDVYVVTKGNEEILIPALKTVIKRFSAEEKILEIYPGSIDSIDDDTEDDNS